MNVKLEKALFTSIFWRGIYFLSVMLLNILVARHFHSDGSGKIYYVINIFAFVQILISLCMEAPMGYYLSQKKMNEAQLSLLAIGWTFFIMVPVYFIIRYFASTIDVPFGREMFSLIATVFLSGNLLIGFFIALFYAKMDFKWPNILLVFINFFLIILVPNNSLISSFLGNDVYVQLYFTGFLAQGIVLAVFFLLKYVRRKDIRMIPFDLLAPFISFALISVVTNSMTYLMYRIDYFFVNKYCSAEALGNYIQACKLQQMFYIIPAILASVVFPMTASGRKEEMNAKMQLLSRGLIISYTLICLILATLGYWLFPFVFGPTFSQMYSPFILLVPAILSYSVVHLLAAYYSGKKVLNINFWGNVIALAVIVTGDVLLIPVLGINGAAMVSSIGYITYMSYMIYAHSKEYKSRFADFLIFRLKDWNMLIKVLEEKFLSQKQQES